MQIKFLLCAWGEGAIDYALNGNDHTKSTRSYDLHVLRGIPEIIAKLAGSFSSFLFVYKCFNVSLNFAKISLVEKLYRHERKMIVY